MNESQSSQESQQQNDVAAQLEKLYAGFDSASFPEIEKMLLFASTREEKAFWRAMLNLKLQIAQEKIIGEILL